MGIPRAQEVVEEEEAAVQYPNYLEELVMGQEREMGLFWDHPTKCLSEGCLYCPPELCWQIVAL